MQRITSPAAWRELRGLAAGTPGLCAWKRGWTGGGQPALRRHWAGVSARPARPFGTEPGRRTGRRRVAFIGERQRLFSSQPGGDDGPPGGSDRQPSVSVVGIPDPITWIRCKVIMYLIDLYFDTDINSVEFERGIKQALVHVSDKMSSGRYHELKGIVSDETAEYVERRCRSLGDARRRQLAVKMEDIIFVLPEDVSVVFDRHGRKFCFIVMRFWLLSPHEGPDDPEGSKIFKLDSGEGGDPRKKVATAVYEFHRELTSGASPDWTVTTVWHWHWQPAE
ncbi:m-AAA protease-interacting protein 1, mitochondrial [Brachyistius frenatus]|uniref:m-AAA protease-interacting protein 1, mitochondrial n=1 Tax=Brachyistius frenatus TaxID=100188 RepID=UPI0037E78F10